MGTRRPPDILRKSHAHSEGDQRARTKRELRDELDEIALLGTDSGGLLIDLDGVVYRGDEAVPGAADAIRWLDDSAIPYLFVTNTTSRPRQALVEKLSGFGIEVDSDRIHAPADAAAGRLRAEGASRLLLAVPPATAGVFAEFDTLTLDQMIDGQARESGTPVDAVVVGDIGASWNFARLNAAFRCLMQEPKPLLIALGMTRYWRAPEGLRLDTAPFVVALSHAAGVEPVVVGKPAAAFFEAATKRLGIEARNVRMIGDDIVTDIGGAQSAGLGGILVRTGKFRPADLELGIEPELIIGSIADLPGALAAVASS